MPVDLYYYLRCPPCRSVLLLAKRLQLELNLNLIDLSKGENRTPQYLKKNPQHTVPAIVDDGFALAESRAILAYLVTQYARDDTLYPRDPKKRAVVDQRLQFDMGTLYQGFLSYYLVPIMNKGCLGDELYLHKLKDAFEILNNILGKQTWVAGDNITIADYTTVVSVSVCEICGFDVSQYPDVAKWYQKAKKEMPGYKEINEKGNNQLKEFLDELMNSGDGNMS